MKKYYLIVIALISVAFLQISCKGSKKNKKTDSFSVIKEIKDEVFSNGNQWEEEDWNKAVAELSDAIEQLPSPLETNEEILLSSALSSISVIAGTHQRKAKKMIDFLNEHSDLYDFSGHSDNKASEQDGVYELYGAVSSYPITMNIEIKDEAVNGSYYYNRKGSTARLKLSGTNDDGTLDLNETDDKGTPTGHFQGVFSDGEFKGVFITNKGNKMPFAVAAKGVTLSDISTVDVGDDDDISSVDEVLNYGGSEEVERLLNAMEEYVDKYVSYMKNASKGNPKALIDGAQLLKKYYNLEEELNNCKGDMSVEQLERMSKIMMKMSNIIEE